MSGLDILFCSATDSQTRYCSMCSQSVNDGKMKVISGEEKFFHNKCYKLFLKSQENTNSNKPRSLNENSWGILSDPEFVIPVAAVIIFGLAKFFGLVS